jgi:hypothetical protein
LERKPESDFNREHVVPEAFGAFGNNLVLDCVCTACNSFFGNTIDLKLARDSIAGLSRFWAGMKSAADYKSLGRNSTTTVRLQDGAIHGSMGHFGPNEGAGGLRVFAFPQVGFQQPPDGPIKWFGLDAIPEKSELATFGIDSTKEFWIHIREISSEHAVALLRDRGFDKAMPFETIEPPDEVVETEAVGIVGRPETRAATKIAMNYLASVAGPGLLRMAQFDEVRDYARNDRGDSRVHTSENPWRFEREGALLEKAHYLAVQTMPNGRIIAQVCLMMRLRYVVHLTSFGFLIGTPNVSSAHLFDVDARTATPITVPPLVQGKQLRVASGRAR